MPVDMNFSHRPVAFRPNQTTSTQGTVKSRLPAQLGRPSRVQRMLPEPLV